ncbi:uncharacterized protein At2g39795, mitochondrial-like [Alnus glutinosa]|uniref:uncharacterized protein At2g39795, mitochondrial-like n=1 Tax=Alnus glutinosa TaxID=3517 RepID=UPI002D79D150|nr:uncharacterized protein At2g39795, mitochondrial-like [Alnus glutinosa]
MASYSMLRRASSSVLSLAIRAVGSPRAFRGVVSSALTAEKGELAHALSRRSFVPTLRFSSASTDKSLIQIIESEIECAEKTHEEEESFGAPPAFPFQIEDKPGERTILLTRSYQDEIIKVEVDIPQIGTEEDEEEDNDDDEEEDGFERIPLFVSITKESGVSLQFGVTASDNEICIDSLSFKQPEVSEDQLAYEGPEFNDLDENLKTAFHKYLEHRGINTTTAKFLSGYMRNKDSKEYLLWLKNLKNFVEK